MECQLPELNLLETPGVVSVFLTRPDTVGEPQGYILFAELFCPIERFAGCCALSGPLLRY